MHCSFLLSFLSIFSMPVILKVYSGDLYFNSSNVYSVPFIAKHGAWHRKSVNKQERLGPYHHVLTAAPEGPMESHRGTGPVSSLQEGS